MFAKSEIEKLEIRYRTTYGLEDNPEDVGRLIADAVYAAEQYPELEKPLRFWMDEKPVFGDVVMEKHASLMETAELLCEEEPDIPLACRLMYLHCSGKCPGIITAAGELCLADRRIFEDDEKICTAFKTEDGWVFLGESASVKDTDGDSPEYTGCELWQMMERAPKLLPLILYPFFAEGTVIYRDNGVYTVQCPADED